MFRFDFIGSRIIKSLYIGSDIVRYLFQRVNMVLVWQEVSWEYQCFLECFYYGYGIKYFVFMLRVGMDCQIGVGFKFVLNR